MTVIVIVVGLWSKITIEMLNKTRITPRTETYRIFDIFANKSLMKKLPDNCDIIKKLIICVPAGTELDLSNSLISNTYLTDFSYGL